MAPPPPTSLPLTERLLTLAKTLQFGWFVGHLTLIICTFRYSLSWIRMNYYAFTPRLFYRIAFVAAAATYGIVVYKTTRSRGKSGRLPGGALGLLGDENVQYLLLALVWLYSSQYLFAMLPYCIYSVFHVATYTRTNLIPTLSPPKVISPGAGASPNARPQYATHPLSDSIGKFVKNYYDSSMSAVAFLEIVIWLRLFLSAITFARGTWILIAIYTVFLRSRFGQSLHVKNAFALIEARIDNLTGAQGMNPTVRNVWESIKTGVRQLYAATDFQKYLGGAPAPRKAS